MGDKSKNKNVTPGRKPRLDDLEERMERAEQRIGRIEGQLGITHIGSEGVPTGGRVTPQQPTN